MRERHHARLWLGAPMLASGLMLAGCMGSPTYGTDKTATEQLANDVTGILSLAPKRREPIDYKPRPDLVRPGNITALPPPQQNVATSSNPAWPESPEQRLARIRAEATANQNNPTYDSPIVPDVAMNSPAPTSRGPVGRSQHFQDSGIGAAGSRAEQRAAYKQRLIETKQGSETNRKYLSEPPLTYRQPSANAPADELGEPEWKKERRAKAAARKNSRWSWRNWLPGA
jgi:hypothetical protein